MARRNGMALVPPAAAMLSVLGLRSAAGNLRQRDQERDLAQKEVFRRLYEERELNKGKTHFQAQLAVTRSPSDISPPEISSSACARWKTSNKWV